MQTGFSKWSKLMGAGAIMMVAVAGCGNNSTTDDGSAEGGKANPLTNNPGTMGNALRGAGAGAGNAVDAAGNSLGNADEAAANALGGGANAVQGAANGAGNSVGGAANAVAGAGRSAVTTPSVKAAIAAKMDANNVNVDTNGGTKTITLSGSVKNAAQSKLAADAARKAAPGYKVVNNLKAAGGSSPTMNR